jgi:acyl-CoA oxidase
LQVGNDLDNAWISFDHVEIPVSSLLSKHAQVEINPDGTAEYVLKNKKIRPFDMIGQRLYTGRIAVAQVSMCFNILFF